MKLIAITNINKKDISVRCKIEKSIHWQMIEAIAQSCGLHLRWLLDFEKHVFLAKIREFEFLSNSLLDCVLVKAHQISLTKSAALYKGWLLGPHGKQELAKGKFLLSHIDFAGDFKKRINNSIL